MSGSEDFSDFLDRRDKSDAALSRQAFLYALTPSVEMHPLPGGGISAMHEFNSALIQ